MIEEIMCFSKCEHRAAAPAGWRSVRLHVRADGNSGQNDVKIKILEVTLGGVKSGRAKRRDCTRLNRTGINILRQ